MEIKSVREFAGWYASFENNQGKALINCMAERIQTDDQLFANILAECELNEEPKECSSEVIVKSIVEMIKHRKAVQSQIGFFRWTA